MESQTLSSHPFIAFKGKKGIARLVFTFMSQYNLRLPLVNWSLQILEMFLKGCTNSQKKQKKILAISLIIMVNSSDMDLSI